MPGRGLPASLSRWPGSWALLALLLPWARALSPCPSSCECSEPVKTVKCVNKELSDIPPGIPASVRTLFITGNNISSLQSGAFGPSLRQLLTLSLSGNRIRAVGSRVFASMPSLQQLDLSNNRIWRLQAAAFGSAPLRLRELDLSGALLNGSVAEQLAECLQSGGLANLQRLRLAENQLVYLPARTFSRLAKLRHLELANNSLLELGGAFRHLSLHTLDLSSNSLRRLANSTLAELGSQPNISIRLRDNPFACDCGIEPLLAWLRGSGRVVDRESLLCASPESLRNTPVLQLQPSELKCAAPGDMERVLQTSYVFLGIVLALIGVIFMFVLYLNRKGIKKWLYNVRDACRDHMEGYHYRYEINSDPRLTNLSSNSDA